MTKPKKAITVLAAALLAGAGLVWAQSTPPRTEAMTGAMMSDPATTAGPGAGCPMLDDGTTMTARHQEVMQKMQAMDAELDGLVATMNESRGEAKTDAVAAVVNELVAARKSMHEAMASMHPGTRMHMTRQMPMEDCMARAARCAAA